MPKWTYFLPIIGWVFFLYDVVKQKDVEKDENYSFMGPLPDRVMIPYLVYLLGLHIILSFLILIF